jgi:hypothetical protein
LKRAVFPARVSLAATKSLKLGRALGFDITAVHDGINALGGFFTDLTSGRSWSQAQFPTLYDVPYLLACVNAGAGIAPLDRSWNSLYHVIANMQLADEWWQLFVPTLLEFVALLRRQHRGIVDGFLTVKNKSGKSAIDTLLDLYNFYEQQEKERQAFRDRVKPPRPRPGNSVRHAVENPGAASSDNSSEDKQFMLNFIESRLSDSEDEEREEETSVHQKPDKLAMFKAVIELEIPENEEGYYDERIDEDLDTITLEEFEDHYEPPMCGWALELLAVQGLLTDAELAALGGIQRII